MHAMATPNFKEEMLRTYPIMIVTTPVFAEYCPYKTFRLTVAPDDASNYFGMQAIFTSAA
jgi:hypothetical protein